LLSLVICILRLLVLEVLALLLLLIGFFLEEIFFNFLVLLEELINLFLVLLQESGTLALKLRLDGTKLVLVISTHMEELTFHFVDELVNVVVHLLHGFDVVFVLGVEGRFKLKLKVFFVGNDLLALDNLLLDVQGQLLAVFFLLKLLPVPVNFYILLV
jgi:hypothetical protein